MSRWIAAASLIASLSACQSADHLKAAHHGAATKAIAVISPTKGNATHGSITFTQVDGGVRVQADLFDLSPGPHGFHVHQWGDVSADNGTATGGHFNPTGGEHSHTHDAGGHMGDLGNIVADNNGHGSYDEVKKTLELNGPNSIIGRGFIVHAGEDDLHSQPTGNAGARIGQGVIGIADPK